MNISIIGIGKLGLCFALTLEKAGYHILGLDINEKYVNLINNKKFLSQEPSVNEYLNKSKNFKATTNFKEIIEFSDVLFVVVATPSLPNGEYNHAQIDKVVEQLISNGKLEKRKDLIICCTTMPEYCDSVQQKLQKYGYVVSYNPEFIAQGTILKNQEKPDIVLIGEGDKLAGDILEKIYKKHTSNNPSICRMSKTEAEICKISLNCFLTTKIAFANMVGDIAINSGYNPEKILLAIGSDTRIGSKYINHGYGYGGPCFPRDNRALAIYANKKGIDALISKASDKSNKLHLDYQVENFIKNNPVNKQVIIESVTYKPDSTILEESQQLLFVYKLAKKGYSVLIKERNSVINELKEKYGDIFIYESRD